MNDYYDLKASIEVKIAKHEEEIAKLKERMEEVEGFPKLEAGCWVEFSNIDGDESKPSGLYVLERNSNFSDAFYIRAQKSVRNTIHIEIHDVISGLITPLELPSFLDPEEFIELNPTTRNAIWQAYKDNA